MSSIIKFTSVKKPKGEEYKKITYWNRFIRTKVEAIIMLLLVILGVATMIYRLGNGTMNSMWFIMSLIFIGYPWLIISQFNRTIRYHLKHRDPAEDAPCEFTVMDNGVLMESADIDARDFVRFDELTSIYLDVFGYYMCFKKNKAVIVIKKSDVPEGQLEALEKMILGGIGSECKIKKFF